MKSLEEELKEAKVMIIYAEKRSVLEDIWDILVAIITLCFLPILWMQEKWDRLEKWCYKLIHGDEVKGDGNGIDKE